MLTLTEAAALLGVAASTLRHQIANGKLRGRLVGKTWTISERELARYRAESLGRPGRRHK
jgi:excisionase family DNA binding protein